MIILTTLEIEILKLSTSELTVSCCHEFGSVGQLASLISIGHIVNRLVSLSVQ